MKQKNALMFAAIALGSIATAACAESTVPKAGEVGLIAKDPIAVTLVADKRGLLGKFTAGTQCNLRPGDTFQVIEVVPDGVLVQRQFHLTAPDKTTCPKGAIAKIPTNAATSGVLAMQAADALKGTKKKS